VSSKLRYHKRFSRIHGSTGYTPVDYPGILLTRHWHDQYWMFEAYPQSLSDTSPAVNQWLSTTGLAGAQFDTLRELKDAFASMLEQCPYPIAPQGLPQLRYDHANRCYYTESGFTVHRYTGPGSRSWRWVVQGPNNQCYYTDTLPFAKAIIARYEI
jgi:hypothetical protein